MPGTTSTTTRWAVARRVLPFAPLAVAMLSQSGIVGKGGAKPPVPTGATAISSSWEKPDPQPTTFSDANGTCGPAGTDSGNATNLRKNRTDEPPSLHAIIFDAISSLPFPTDQPPKRAEWSPEALAAIKPFEGVGITVTGYLVDRVKIEGAESTNCGWTAPAEVDWHLPLVKTANAPEASAVVVETTPRMRRSHPGWTAAALKPWVNSTLPVRVSGWLMLDPEHRAAIGKQRSTLWEVHPITKIEVFKAGQWVDLDDTASGGS